MFILITLLQTRNNEKYSKNKDRNRQRAIDLERHKIRHEAVKQAERLAAKYDPSGKTFNVSEIVVLEDGRVRSKEGMRIAKEHKIQREKDKKAAKEAKQAALELKEARKAAKARGQNPATALKSIDAERLAQIQGAKHISNTQKRRLALYAPKPVPPKPVLPEGISLPEGEENMIALWDITDEDVIKRLANTKRKKGQQRAAFKNQQRKEKIFRRAMKTKKKQAINRGEDFDPEQAVKEILEEQKLRQSNKSMSKTTSDDESDWDSDSDSDSSSYSDSSSDSGSEAEAKVSEAKAEFEEKTKSKKRPSSDVTDGDAVATKEPNVKKSKKSKDSSSADSKADQTSVAAGSDQASKKRKKDISMLAPSDPLPTPEAIKKIVQKEKVRAKNAKKRQEKLAKAPEEAEKAQSKPKKRKRSKEQEEAGPVKEAKPEKSHKKKKAKVEEPAAAPTESTNGAEQWNPDALTGDEARKAKFLRLLGAGKSHGATSSSKHKSQADSAAISKVQGELEKQYEAGMKLKHDGGSKRRGIGA